jgi:hypothetical protein
MMARMLLLLAPPPALAYEPVEAAVGVHVSAEGFDRLGAAVADLLPAAFPVGALHGEFACDEGDPSQVLAWSLGALTLDIAFQEVSLVPGDGRLDLTLYGSLASSASTLTATGDCSPLADLAETCAVEIPTVPLEMHLPISLAWTNGAFDATVGDVAFVLGPITNPLDGCILADAIGTLLGEDPSLVSALIEDAVAPSLADLGGTLEPALEDALASLLIETSLAVGDGEVALSLAPTSFVLDSQGLFLGLGGEVSATEVSTCVSAGVAPAGGGAWPALTGTAPDGALVYDASAVINTAFADQVLFGVYQSGALCIDLADLAGASLDTSLFNPIFGEDWSALFPDAAPMRLAVRPRAAPTATGAEDGPPLRVHLDGLNIAGYAELDGREAKVFSVTMAGSIGVDLPIEDGVLTPAIIVDDALQFVEDDHELLAEGYADGLAAFVPTILGSVLPDLPTVAIPSFRGIGLGHLWWIPSDGWVGGWATLSVDDVQPIELSGCAGGSIGCEDGGLSTGDIDIGAELGCDDTASGCGGESGCEGGSACGHSPLGTRFPFLVALLVPLLRRRG